MIKIFDTPGDTLLNFAYYLESIINESISNNNEFHLALSGGSTPQLLFKLLKEEYKNKIDWNFVHFYWGDERCVSPESSESNYGIASKLFLNYINIPDNNIHRIRGEDNSELEVKRYSNEILKYVPSKNSLPQFDLIILGLGKDGHTASIFPDQIDIMDSDNICEVAIQPETKQKRITLTGKVINNSKNVSFIVSSKDKSMIVSEIFNKLNGYKNYPAANIKIQNDNIRWYLDKDASSLIK